MKSSFLWAISLSLVFLFFVILMLTKKEKELIKSTNSQFECGFTTMNPSQIPFSFQFFLIALLFLIFDIEIALILSFPLEPQTTKNLLTLSVFLSILIIGLMYEWQKSKLDWSK